MLETLEAYNQFARERAEALEDHEYYSSALRLMADACIGRGLVDYHHGKIRVLDGFGGVVFEGSRDSKKDVAMATLLSSMSDRADHHATMVELMRMYSKRADHYYRMLQVRGIDV